MQHFFANGKLLLTGEYYVLENALALALPSRLGQHLTVENRPISPPTLQWDSYDKDGKSWLSITFRLPTLEIIKSTNVEKAIFLQKILLQAQQQNPIFLQNKQSYQVNTKLDFPLLWGLGSSSTLIANIAAWANVNPFTLAFKTIGGSGYDIACANYKQPILYQKNGQQPLVKMAAFSPIFQDQLYFVYLGKKQNSRTGIKHFYNNTTQHTLVVQRLDELTKAILVCTDLATFCDLLTEHEEIIQQAIQLPRAAALYFADYWGTVKSLGAWGGDFVLATSTKTKEETQQYFLNKGFETCVPYAKLVYSFIDLR